MKRAFMWSCVGGALASAYALHSPVRELLSWVLFAACVGAEFVLWRSARHRRRNKHPWSAQLEDCVNGSAWRRAARKKSSAEILPDKPWGRGQ